MAKLKFILNYIKKQQAITTVKSVFLFNQLITFL